MSPKPLRLWPVAAAAALALAIGSGGVATATTPTPDTSTATIVATTETPEEVVEAPAEPVNDTPEETIPEAAPEDVSSEPATEADPESAPEEPTNDTSEESATEAVTEEPKADTSPAATSEPATKAAPETPVTEEVTVTQTGTITVTCERDNEGILTGFWTATADSDNSSSSEENEFIPSESKDGGEFFELTDYTRTVPAGETATVTWNYGRDYDANEVVLNFTSDGVVLSTTKFKPNGCTQPDDKVTYGKWIDGEANCETGKVAQTRTVTTTPHVFVGTEWVLDPENASVTTEPGSRDMSKEELAKCEGPPVEADNTFTAVADRCDDTTSPTGTGSITGTATNTDDETDKSVDLSVEVRDITNEVVAEQSLGAVADGVTVPFVFEGLYLASYTIEFFEAGKSVKEIPVDVPMCEIVQPELAPVVAVGEKCYANFTNPVDNPESVKVPYGSFDNDEPDGTIEVKPGETVKVETTRAQLDFIAYGSESYAYAGSGSVKVDQECGVTPTPKPPVPPKVDDPRQPPFVAPQPMPVTTTVKMGPQVETDDARNGIVILLLGATGVAALAVFGLRRRPVAVNRRG
jgi:hypothetical protein